MIGKTICGYQIDQQVCSTENGEVYRAQDSMLAVPRAIKILSAKAMKEEGALSQLHTAVETWARLDYSSFVQIYSCLDGCDGYFGYIMSFAEGNSLQQLFSEQSQLGASQTIDYFLQIAKAIQFANELGFVHSKLAPKNIIIGRDESLKITGLGGMRQAGRYPATQTNYGPYQAPEQKEGVFSPAVDQYALGAILYEMACGKPAPSHEEMESVRDKAIPNFNPDLGDDLQQIIWKSISLKPEDRYPSLKEFLEAVMFASDRLNFSEDISDQSLMHHGRHSLERRKLESAVYYFNKVLETYGKDTTYYEEAKQKRSQALKIVKEEEDLKELRSLYSTSLQYFDEEEDEEACRYVRKILNIVRDYPDSGRVRGIFLEVKREMPMILEDAETRENKGITNSTKLTEEGKDLLRQVKYDDALHIFREALNHDPKNKEAHYWRNITLRKRKISLLAKCYCDGKQALHKRDYPQAVSFFGKVLELQPDHKQSQRLLQIAKEEEKKALETVEKVKNSYQDGLKLYEQWQFHEALEKFREVLQLDEEHAGAQNFAGLVEQRLSEENKIEEIGFFYQKGVSFYDNGKWRESITCFKRVLKDMGTHKKAQEYMKVATHNLEKEESLAKVFQEAMQLFRESKYTQALQKFDYLAQKRNDNPQVSKYQRLCREFMKQKNKG